jgi:hypothetical protein
MLTISGRSLCVCAGTLLSLALVGGCGDKGAGGSVRASDPGEPVNTGLRSITENPALALPSDEELMTIDDEQASVRAQIEESARQLSVYFTNLELDGPPEGVVEEPVTRRPVQVETPAQTTISDPVRRAEKPSQPNPDVSSTDDGGVRVSLSDLAGEGFSGAEEEEQADSELKPTEASNAPEPVRLDPEAKRDQLARELAGILGELVELGDDPARSALALASLEMLLPDDATTLVDQGVLSEPELATIDAVRSLLRSMTSEGELVSPDRLLSQLEDIHTQLNAWAGLSIKRAALCTRVEGYGRYETFPSYRFLAGRAQEVIVYTELDHFMQREGTGPDGQTRYEIELSQRLELYHVADDLNTWNEPADTVHDVSRNRLRDYYLTNLVKLPANLGVGRYHLKIVMRDLIGEKVSETIIPIEIVAQ